MIDFENIEIPAIQIQFELAQYKIPFTTQNIVDLIYTLKNKRLPSGTTKFWTRITTTDHASFILEIFYNNISKNSLEHYFESEAFQDLLSIHSINDTPVMFDSPKQSIYFTNLTFGYF